MAFSRRASWDLTLGEVHTALSEARADGRRVIDLTESNPTRIDLRSARSLSAELGRDRASDRYDPDPRGMIEARSAIARYYRERGLFEVQPDRIVLSASTSEAYAWIFKLLCDPGDVVLVPSPSYPLFSYLAALEAVRVVSYPLVRSEGFRIDVERVASLAREHRARAVVVVAPNNPTGTLVEERDARSLERVAEELGIALVVDEVFGDYVWDPRGAEALRPSFVGPRPCLTFVLSGLSKVLCAPGLKLGWTVVDGPEQEAREALDRLEIVADTYLSVSTPVQVATGALLERRREIQSELRQRIDENRRALASAIAQAPSGALRVAPGHGGWTSLVEVPRIMAEAAWVKILAGRAGVLVQPGFFFDIEDGGTLALSLIVEPVAFAEGIGRLVTCVEAELS